MYDLALNVGNYFMYIQNDLSYRERKNWNNNNNCHHNINIKSHDIIILWLYSYNFQLNLYIIYSSDNSKQWWIIYLLLLYGYNVIKVLLIETWQKCFSNNEIDRRCRFWENFSIYSGASSRIFWEFAVHVDFLKKRQFK